LRGKLNSTGIKTHANMDKTVKTCRTETVCFNRCSETCRIPNSTLKLNLVGKVKRGNSGERLNCGLPTLPSGMGNETEDHIIKEESSLSA
jgi:hypothetical protein